MIVLDASSAVEWLLHTPAGLQIEERIYANHDSLHAPALIDIEVAQVLRRLVRQRTITEQRGGETIDDLQDVRITRYPNVAFLDRVWELCDNLSAYDAAYLALAEALNAPLLTRDARLKLAPNHSAQVEVF